MKKRAFLFLAAIIIAGTLCAQENPLQKFDNLIGKWQGTGEGFSAAKSNLDAEYAWIMNKQYIQVKHRSVFEPTEKKPEGEIHEDVGIISFDKGRKVYVFRQYHIEGFYNEYVLNESLSNEKTIVFETEKIENFVPGGRARFTINVKSDSEIETLFDVGFPGKEMSCFGKNQLRKKK